MPFLHVTTRIEGHPHDDLLSEKGGAAFPTLMFLDAEGHILQKHGGPRSVKGFEDSFQLADEFQKLIAKGEAGNAAAATEALIRQIELGWYGHEEAAKRVAALTKVGAKEQKILAQLLIETEVRDVAKGVGNDAGKMREAGEHFLGMWRAERVPATADVQYPFWFLMGEYAFSQNDKKLYRDIVSEAKSALGKNGMYDRALEALEARTKKM